MPLVKWPTQEILLLNWEYFCKRSSRICLFQWWRLIQTVPLKKVRRTIKIPHVWFTFSDHGFKGAQNNFTESTNNWITVESKGLPPQCAKGHITKCCACHETTTRLHWHASKVLRLSRKTRKRSPILWLRSAKTSIACETSPTFHTLKERIVSQCVCAAQIERN